MRIFFFGDNITQGFFESQGGWAQRLANEYHQETLRELDRENPKWIECFNLGVSGDTAEELLGRIGHEIEVRELDDDENIIVIAIGTNNSILRDNRALMDVYTFQEVFEKILDTAQKYSDKILCVGLTAVDELLTDPIEQSSTGKQYHNQRLNVFEDTIKQSAGRKEVPFVPIHDVFLEKLNSGEELLSDGLHPNDAGHALIYHSVKPELEKLLA
jgi:lysophospholipase L1-like esterase